MINIQDIIPFMRKGWVAMDKSGEWFYYETKPKIVQRKKWVDFNGCAYPLDEIFDITPADDWTKSLTKVGGK